MMERNHSSSYVSPSRRESAERYRALFESSLDAIMTLDPPSWRFTTANPTTLKMFKAKDQAEFISMDPWKLSPEKQQDGWLSVDKAADAIEIALRDGSYLFEWTHKRLNGEEFPATVLLTRVEISGNKFLQAIVHDTTRRKQIEEQLKQSTARLILATRAGGVGVWDYDIVHNILLWDDQMFALYGIKKQEFNGVYEAWQAGVHLLDKERSNAEIEMAIRGEKEFDTEFRVCWEDGSIHNIRAIAVVQRDDSGNPLRMIGTNWDITEFRKAEREKLALSESKMRTTLYSIGDAVISLDINGCVLLMNPMAEKLTGWSEPEACGKPLEDVFCIVQEETHSKVDNPVVQVLKGGIAVGIPDRTLLIARNGVECPIGDSAAPIFDQELNIIGVVLIFRDLTKEREMQEKLLISEKLAVMGRLVADVAHEINNPLAIIIGRTQLMLHRLEEQPSPLTGQLETVLQSARRCKTILSNLLTYCKTIGGKEETINLSDLIMEAVENVNDQYQMHAVHVTLHCMLPANIKITSNKHALLSVFVNLIRNARQAMPEKGNLTITVEKKDESQLQIEIHDTGIGMSKEQVSQLFQPFISGWEEYDGTGLGLATSLGIIEAYGGKIWAESEGRGKGATFTILLPYIQNEKKTNRTVNELED
ncbi:MAG: PAS domain S-box protein [Bacteroidota bacterium]